MCSVIVGSRPTKIEHVAEATATATTPGMIKSDTNTYIDIHVILEIGTHNHIQMFFFSLILLAFVFTLQLIKHLIGIFCDLFFFLYLYD